MFSFIHTYIVSKSPGGGFYAFSFTPFPPDPEKSRYRRRFFLLRFPFWLCSVPLYLPCAPKGSPSFSLCCAGDTCFFRFDARPLLCCRKLGLSFPEKGKTPVGNATSEELAAYNAWFAASPEENIIYLTFDCGYENGNTPAILDALQKHQAPAAFFVVGNFLSDQPDLVKRMAAEGHIVGNHTWSHPDMSKISTQEAFSEELNRVSALYQETTSQEMVKFYRPPQGKYSTQNLQMAKDLGYQTFFWSLAYVDWYQDQQPTHEEAFKKLTGRIHPGAIVLLHNTSSTNAEILDELLTKWEEMGYSFGSLDQLASKSA